MLAYNFITSHKPSQKEEDGMQAQWQPASSIIKHKIQCSCYWFTFCQRSFSVYLQRKSSLGKQAHRLQTISQNQERIGSPRASASFNYPWRKMGQKEEYLISVWTVKGEITLFPVPWLQQKRKTKEWYSREREKVTYFHSCNKYLLNI